MFDIQLCLTVTARQLKDNAALAAHSLSALRALQAVAPTDVARVASVATLYCSAVVALGSGDVAAAVGRTLTALTLAYGSDHALVAAFRRKFGDKMPKPEGDSGSSGRGSGGARGPTSGGGSGSSGSGGRGPPTVPTQVQMK